MKQTLTVVTFLIFIGCIAPTKQRPNVACPSTERRNWPVPKEALICRVERPQVDTGIVQCGISEKQKQAYAQQLNGLVLPSDQLWSFEYAHDEDITRGFAVIRQCKMLLVVETEHLHEF